MYKGTRLSISEISKTFSSVPEFLGTFTICSWLWRACWSGPEFSGTFTSDCSRVPLQMHFSGTFPFLSYNQAGTQLLKSQLFQLFRNGTYHDNFSATIRNGLSADLTPNSCVEFSGFQIDPYSNANAINVWDKYCKPFFHAIASCWWTS